MNIDLLYREMSKEFSAVTNSIDSTSTAPIKGFVWLPSNGVPPLDESVSAVTIPEEAVTAQFRQYGAISYIRQTSVPREEGGFRILDDSTLDVNIIVHGFSLEGVHPMDIIDRLRLYIGTQPSLQGLVTLYEWADTVQLGVTGDTSSGVQPYAQISLKVFYNNPDKFTIIPETIDGYSITYDGNLINSICKEV